MGDGVEGLDEQSLILVAIYRSGTDDRLMFRERLVLLCGGNIGGPVSDDVHARRMDAETG